MCVLQPAEVAVCAIAPLLLFTCTNPEQIQLLDIRQLIFAQHQHFPAAGLLSATASLSLSLCCILKQKPAPVCVLGLTVVVVLLLFQNNQVVGVGSGSTIVYAVDRLGESHLT